MKILFQLLFCFLLIGPIHGQNPFKKAKDIFMSEAKRKASDAVARKLAYEALKPVNKVFDDWVRESYEQEYGKDIPPEKQDSIFKAMGKNYEDFLANMNKSVDLPESFNFDFTMDVEVEDYNKDKSEFMMLYSSTQPVFAVRQYEGDQKNLIVMNIQDNYIVLFTEDKKGEKKAQVISGMFSNAAMMASTNNAEYMNLKLEGPGKSKTFFDKYKAFEYKGETEEYKFKYYYCSEFPIQWNKSSGSVMKRFSPNAYNKMSEQVNGVIVEGETVKKDGKKKSKWKTKNISTKPENVKTNEWNFEGMN